MSMESVVHWLRKIYQENTRQSKAIKSWVGEDVSQHDERLKEYKKQTKIMGEILREIRLQRGAIT